LLPNKNSHCGLDVEADSGTFDGGVSTSEIGAESGVEVICATALRKEVLTFANEFDASDVSIGALLRAGE
jgi:hypothetical protein